MTEDVIRQVFDVAEGAWLSLSSAWLDLTTPLADRGISRWWLAPLALVPLTAILVLWSIARVLFLATRRRWKLVRQRSLYADVVSLRQQVRNYERLVRELG